MLVQKSRFKIILFQLVLCFILSATHLFSQAPIPDGERWKDLTGDSLTIGGVIGWGNYFPLADMAQWKVDSRTVLLRECNGANSLCYPFGTWTGPYTYDFDRFNDAVSWLYDNNIFHSAHTLGGGGHYYADWLKNGSFTNEELEDMLHQYIKTIIQSNDNHIKVNAWNVVNEALAGDNENVVWRPSPFRQLGDEADQSGFTGDDKVFSTVPVYIRKSFEFARMYTDKKLEYRDNNFQESTFRNAREMYQLMAHLKNAGVPVDVVGFQAHGNIDNTYNWNDFKNQVRKFKDLGYEVWVQELDASNDGSEADRQRQREFIYKAVRACREAGVTFINFWVMRDGVGQQNPWRGWFDVADYAPKPSYYGIQDALAADITVGVIEETIFKCQADAHVRTDKPTTNEGTRSNFTVQYNTGDETQFRSFLRFNISGLSDKTITDIKLRMKVRTGDTNAHFEVRKVAGDWSETEITWDNQPDIGSTSYGSYTPATAPARQVWMKAALDPSLITEDGNLDIVLYPISSGSTEDLLFNSRETRSDPQLVVTYEMGGAVNIDDPENKFNLPSTITLEQNYPNPFNPQTHIGYGLPASADVQLKIYDVLGRLVKTLVNNQQSAGNYKVIWNGLDSGNNQVSSGVYFYNLQAKSGNKTFSQQKKMLMLR